MGSNFPTVLSVRTRTFLIPRFCTSMPTSRVHPSPNRIDDTAISKAYSLLVSAGVANLRRLSGSVWNRGFICVCEVFAWQGHDELWEPTLPIKRRARWRALGRMMLAAMSRNCNDGDAGQQDQEEVAVGRGGRMAGILRDSGQSTCGCR